jgi:hypothetical protein
MMLRMRPELLANKDWHEKVEVGSPEWKVREEDAF